MGHVFIQPLHLLINLLLIKFRQSQVIGLERILHDCQCIVAGSLMPAHLPPPVANQLQNSHEQKAVRPISTGWDPVPPQSAEIVGYPRPTLPARPRYTRYPRGPREPFLAPLRPP